MAAAKICGSSAYVCTKGKLPSPTVFERLESMQMMAIDQLLNTIEHVYEPSRRLESGLRKIEESVRRRCLWRFRSPNARKNKKDRQGGP